MRKYLIFFWLGLLTGCHSKGVDRLLGNSPTHEEPVTITTPIVTPTTPVAVQRTTQTFLLAGQSNMVRMTQYGLDAFKTEYLRLHPNTEINFVPCAVGGTWSGQWSPNNGLLEDCVADARNAGLVPTQILYYQGESDAYLQRSDWHIYFTQTVNEFRRYYPGIPLIFAQIAISNDPGGFDRGWVDIQNQQASISIPGVKMIITKDVAELIDTVHLTPASLELIAKRFANAAQ